MHDVAEFRGGQCSLGTSVSQLPRARVDGKRKEVEEVKDVKERHGVERIELRLRNTRGAAGCVGEVRARPQTETGQACGG